MANKKYYTGKSKIQGKGAFAKQSLKPGDFIGKVHTINQPYVDYDFTDLGRNHNHSENPNVENVLVGNERHLVATKPIKKGQELTSNYRLQPDLEQPEDFKKGGWLDKYSPATAENGIEGTMGGLTDKGFNYNGAWGGQFQMGGNVYPVNYVPQSAMGSSIPGSVGFTYARTNSPAPSEGPYAKKTMPSAQNGREMSYYQHGLDWKPKTISRDGSVIPTAQTGEFYRPDYVMPRAASESTAISRDTSKGKKTTATTGQKKEDVKASTEAMGRGKKREKDEEKARVTERKSAVAAKDKGKPFTLPSGKTKKYEDMNAREKMYVSGKALEQRGRFNEDEESFFDEYLNPLSFIGSVAGALGTAPYEANLYDSNLPYIGAVATPLITGALGFDPLGSAINVSKTPVTKVGRELARIEKQGLSEGLSTHEIAKRQLEQVGITSNQRQSYIPGVSEFLETYVPPYGYTGFGKDSKLTQTLKTIFGKDYKKYSEKGILSENRNPAREDAWSLYLGKPQQYNTFRMAETAPINHPSYPSGSLKGMDVYSVNYEDELIPKVGQTSPNVGTSTNPHIVEKKIEPLLKKITLDREANVMGGYNRRLSSSGLQYNDIWDLDPTMKIPFVDKKVTVPISKFIGKPFMSHGNIPYTWTEHQANLTKFLDSKIADRLATQMETGVDFTPQVSRLMQQLEKVKSAVPIQKKGGIIEDNRGQWAHPGEITEIDSNRITMQGVPYPVLGISDQGDMQMMYPEKEYKFKGKKVTEFPMMQQTKKVNQKPSGSWLDGYK